MATYNVGAYRPTNPNLRPASMRDNQRKPTTSKRRRFYIPPPPDYTSIERGQYAVTILVCASGVRVAYYLHLTRLATRWYANWYAARECARHYLRTREIPD